MLRNGLRYVIKLFARIEVFTAVWLSIKSSGYSVASNGN